MSTETEPLISLTQNAADHVREMLAGSDENAGKSLRIYVESGGCSGMQYGLVFDEKRADDVVMELRGVSVLLDPFSAGYVRGAVVDYVDAMTGGGFKIRNPNARESCGCGKSFQT